MDLRLRKGLGGLSRVGPTVELELEFSKICLLS